MSLTTLISNYNLENSKVDLLSECDRYICYTRINKLESTWFVYATNGIAFWNIKLKYLDLVNLSKSHNEMGVEAFLAIFRSSLDSRSVSIAEVANELNLTLTNGHVLHLNPVPTLESQQELRKILFELFDEGLDYTKQLQTARTKITTLKAQSNITSSLLMDIGPKTAATYKPKLSKEGMSAVNPLSKKRKTPQGVIYD